MFHMDVAKVDRNVAYAAKCAASVSDACFKHLFKVFHLFQTYVEGFLSGFAYVSHICCKSMFQMFQLFHSYVAISVFMLQVFYLDVAYVSHICCKCMF